MSEYLIGHDVNAVIGLGDLVMSSTRTVLDNVGIKAGDVPVVGWGNSKATAESVRDGYVLAALWQYPIDLGFLPVVLLNSASDGNPIGYDIYTLQLYDAKTVDPILAQYN